MRKEQGHTLSAVSRSQSAQYRLTAARASEKTRGIVHASFSCTPAAFPAELLRPRPACRRTDCMSPVACLITCVPTLDPLFVVCPPPQRPHHQEPQVVLHPFQRPAALHRRRPGGPGRRVLHLRGPLWNHLSLRGALGSRVLLVMRFVRCSGSLGLVVQESQGVLLCACSRRMFGLG